MLLEAVPSFSGQWSEIEDDPIHLDEATGMRLETGRSLPPILRLARKGQMSPGMSCELS
jgi:hypothetical protein